MEYQELLHRCFRCGWCKLPGNFTGINCPAYMKNGFETFAPGGRLWLLRAWMDKEIETSDRFLEVMFSCSTCKNCAETCAIPEIKDRITDIIIAGRQELVSRGVLPPGVKNYFMNVYNRGNPYKKNQEERCHWAEGLGVPRYDGQEYLFFVGDEGSFDEKGIAMARSVASLLMRAGVSIGILGEDELSDGNDIYAAGEKDLFTHLAGKNSDTFIRRGIGKIIALSPHAYNAIKNDYPMQAGPTEVIHYTQILGGLAKGLSMKKYEKKVTYHDPCYLGRWNGEYWPARIALAAIPGIQVVEMDRSMSKSLCCGGGGGNFHTDILGSGEMSASRDRVREALDTGAEVLAVACPVCLKMLDDAVKDEGAERELRVLDISGIITEAMA